MENFIRLKDVMRITGIARSTIWLWIKNGQFPKSIKISPRVTVWKVSDIQQWIEEKAQGMAS